MMTLWYLSIPELAYNFNTCHQFSPEILGSVLGKDPLAKDISAEEREIDNEKIMSDGELVLLLKEFQSSKELRKAFYSKTNKKATIINLGEKVGIIFDPFFTENDLSG